MDTRMMLNSFICLSSIDLKKLRPAQEPLQKSAAKGVLETDKRKADYISVRVWT